MKLNNKNKLLVIGFILGVYVCYVLAISNTIAYYNEYATKKEIIASNNYSPELANQLLAKEKQLDKLLQKYKIASSESIQNILLKQLNGYANAYNLKVIDFQEPHIFIENNETTSSYIFSLKGSYNGCLAAINKLEISNNLGFIKHLNFNKKLNYKSNSNELIVEVILQRKSS